MQNVVGMISNLRRGGVGGGRAADPKKDLGGF